MWSNSTSHLTYERVEDFVWALVRLRRNGVPFTTYAIPSLYDEHDSVRAVFFVVSNRVSVQYHTCVAVVSALDHGTSTSCHQVEIRQPPVFLAVYRRLTVDTPGAILVGPRFMAPRTLVGGQNVIASTIHVYRNHPLPMFAT